MIGVPEIEVLEGPVGITLSVRGEPVQPRAAGCAKKVPGGTVLLTADGIAGKAESKLTYRVNYKTKDGPRQEARVYIVSLFPR